MSFGGEVIEPIYGDRTLIDETDEYQLYHVTRPIDEKRFLVWLKEGEKFTLTLWLEPDKAELNQRVLAAFGRVEVH